MPEGSTPTQRSRFEQEVLHALLETLELGNVGLSIVALDVDPPEYIFMSTAGPALLGYTVEEFVKIPVWELFPSEDLPALHARHRERMADPTGTRRLEMYVKHRNGTKIPVEVTTSRITFAGRPANVSFIHDASSRIAALRALEASETRFRQLVESAPDGVVILRGTTLSYVNPAAAAMLGFERPDDAIGRRLDDLLDRSDAVRAESRISELQRTQQRFADSAEYRSRRRDGREIVVEISSMPIEFEGGPATLAFARDITER
ncbi:MAG TPA: PAS domain S-box protein, partial [Polyangiaceae bacterium]|nr:PAS domain S-box protein [Polyangiaceae bacterium]